MSRKRTNLGQEIIAASSQCFVSVTLQAASCQCDNNYRTPEQRQIRQTIFFTERALDAWPLLWRRSGGIRGTGTTGSCLGKDANSIQSFQPADLLGGIQSVHDGELNIHQHQVKPALSPFAHRLLAVRRALPPHAQSLHERFEKLLVDNVVLHDEDVDWWHSAINQSPKDCTR